MHFVRTPGTRRHLARFVAPIALAAIIFLPAAASRASTEFCSDTAELQERACLLEASDDSFKAKAICLNLADPVERAACNQDADEALAEARQLCDEQEDARETLCDKIGEARYEPDFDPARYEDPRSPRHPNPYFPLAVGNHWTFSGGSESVDVEVLDEVKLIEGVRCIVVNDLVAADGAAIEDTDDWFAQRSDGTVVYCGESVRDFETFPGDDPEEPELTSIDGSFKAGRDGDKPGTLFPATPRVGSTYRQEWSAGNAEDAATVLSTTYGYGRNPQLDQFAPRALVRKLCAANDCVVIAEFSPIEPDVLEYKYYARGLGKFLGVNVRTGEVSQLVDCNFDRRCSSLPKP